MWDIIHTEAEGSIGFSIAIVFYFCAIAVMFLVVTFGILPAVKSFTGSRHATAVSRTVT